MPQKIRMAMLIIRFTKECPHTISVFMQAGRHYGSK